MAFQNSCQVAQHPVQPDEKTDCHYHYTEDDDTENQPSNKFALSAKKPVFFSVLTLTFNVSCYTNLEEDVDDSEEGKDQKSLR